MDDASVKMSTTSVWCFVAPIISNSDDAALWQTYNVSWSVSPSIEATYKVEVSEDSSNTNTIPADPSRKIEATVSSSGLSITGLSSRTKYIAEVAIRTSDNFTYDLKLPFETKSFAGNYIWNNQYYDGEPENGPENFSVTVSAGSDSGSFPYSVKINSDDSNWDGTMHRVMPLVDSTGEIPAIDFASPQEGYEDSNKAYNWNFRKWANIDLSGFIGTLATPKSWQPTSTTVYRDSVTTNVLSKTLVEAETETTFSFNEINGVPCLIFRNFCGNTMAQGYIFNNEKQYKSEGMADQYSFLLKYAGAAEEENK